MKEMLPDTCNGCGSRTDEQMLFGDPPYCTCCIQILEAIADEQDEQREKDERMDEYVGNKNGPM